MTIRLFIYLLLTTGLLSSIASAQKFPFADGTFDENDKLVQWSLEKVRKHRDDAIGDLKDKTTIPDKDNAAVPGLLGYKSDKVEGISDEKERYNEENNIIDPEAVIIKTVLDLTTVDGLVYFAIQVDDQATLTVKEIPTGDEPTGYTPITKTYEVKGTALWRVDRSYKEFPDSIPAGRKYNLKLNYRNTANLTDKYDGKTDFDGVNVFLMHQPVELITDIDNDGQLKHEDGILAKSAYKIAASTAEIENATEFIFLNDNLSNGQWDKEDASTPGKPTSATDDDDAEEIQIKMPGLPDATEVWIDHPAITGLTFYTSRQCLPSEVVNLSPSQHYVVSPASPISKLQKLYIRVDKSIAFSSTNPQVEGDMKLMLKSTGASVIEASKIKFTVVREMRAKNYFHAVRDYIYENNTSLRVDDKKFPEGSSSPTCTIRICLMCEESTKMVPIESYWDDAYAEYLSLNPPPGTSFEPALYTKHGFGIDGALAADPSMTVVINGNQCDLTDPTLPTAADDRRNTLTALTLLGETNVSDRCHGRVVIKDQKNQSSSDLDDPSKFAAGTSFRGSYLAGSDPIAGDISQAGGKHIAQYEDGHFEIDKGRVPWPNVPGTLPTTPLPTNAMGGLSGNYSDPKRDDFPNSFVGLVPLQIQGKGVVFVAMGKAKHNVILGVQYTTSDGNGHVHDFYEAAKASGVPKIAGATPAGKDDVIQLVMLDSGDTSSALTHVTPAGTHEMVFKGVKHNGMPYYTNTFLRFKAQKPR